MMTTILLVAMFLCLLGTDLRSILQSGQRRLAWFYSICYGISFVVLVLHSMGVSIYGPSQWVMDIAKALALI